MTPAVTAIPTSAPAAPATVSAAPASATANPASATPTKAKPAFGILGILASAHMVNDMMQSLILAMYPILKGEFSLNFAQIGIITLTFQLTASLLQPLVGYFTDRRPQPYSLPLGMCSTLIGLMFLAFAPSFGVVLIAAAFIGVGSAVFHPESSRIARLASGGQHGLAQSLFQLGGNLGSSIGPLMAAAIIVPYGQHSVGWFGLATLLGSALLLQVSRWYSAHHLATAKKKKAAVAAHYSRNTVIGAVGVLLVVMFSKYFYTAGIASFYTFYLISHFGLSVQSAQYHLFYFLLASAVGTVLGGRIGDRIGRKPVIWASIVGVAPFALLLPHADLFWTTALTILIGLVLSSTFSAIVVYGQELMPGRVGMVSGLFFGFSFGMGGLGAAVLGMVADATSVDAVFRVIAWLPLIGLVAVWLPKDPPKA